MRPSARPPTHAVHERRLARERGARHARRGGLAFAQRLCLALAAPLLVGNAPARGSPPPALDRRTEARADGGAVALAVAPDGMAAIAGGRFDMGSGRIELAFAIELCRTEPLAGACNSSWWLSEAPLHPVTLGGFWIDRTEVTVEAYRRCVDAGVCAAPGFVAGDPKRDRPRLPVTFVSWEDADRYCRYRGARLPTEAEWERAARGANDRRFPWGQTPDPRRANHGSLDAGSVVDATITPGRIDSGIEDPSDGYAGLAPVGSFPSGATPEGVVDLAGNVAEWVADTWRAYDAPSTGVGGSGSGSMPHVTRGGSYRMPMVMLRGAARGVRPRLVSRDPDVGFRCARDLAVGSSTDETRASSGERS
jgi:sulfatase modifying factor 1